MAAIVLKALEVQFLKCPVWDLGQLEKEPRTAGHEL
jgi:hypothetical protein